MKLYNVSFIRSDRYQKLLDVFIYSAKFHMPKIELEIEHIDPPPQAKNGGDQHHVDCNHSFLREIEYAIHSKEELAVCDTDLMFLRSIEDVSKRNFDIAITVRKVARKYNTGLWFTKPTSKAVDFLKLWRDKTILVTENFDTMWPRYKEYAGIDQISLHLALQDNLKKDYAHVIKLPCVEWNATQDEWEFITPKTRVIHIKSILRRILINDWDIDENHKYLIPLIQRFQAYLETARGNG